MSGRASSIIGLHFGFISSGVLLLCEMKREEWKKKSKAAFTYLLFLA
jgi:hypothetical protein